MSYTDRLANLGLHSLEYRRVCFKIVKNLVDLDTSAFFRINLSPYSTRGNSIKLSPLSSPLTIIFAQTFSQSELYTFGIHYQTQWLQHPPKTYLGLNSAT